MKAFDQFLRLRSTGTPAERRIADKQLRFAERYGNGPKR